MYWSQGLKLGLEMKLKRVCVNHLCSLFFTQVKFWGVFHSNELGSFFGSNSSCNEYLMEERLKSLGSPLLLWLAAQHINLI